MEFLLDAARQVFVAVVAILFVISLTGLFMLGMREFLDVVLRLMDEIEYLMKPKSGSRKDEP